MQSGIKRFGKHLSVIGIYDKQRDSHCDGARGS